MDFVKIILFFFLSRTTYARIRNYPKAKLLLSIIIFSEYQIFRRNLNKSGKNAKNWRGVNRRSLGGRNKSGQSTAKYRSFSGVTLFSTCDAYHSVARSMRYVLRFLACTASTYIQRCTHSSLRTIS